MCRGKYPTLKKTCKPFVIEPADSCCRFVKPPQDDFNRRPDYPPQQQQQQGQGAFNRQGSYNQQQGPGQPPGFQRKPGFNQDQAYGGRPDFKQRQQQGYGARDAAPAARKRRQFSVSIQNTCPMQRRVPEFRFLMQEGRFCIQID